MLQLAWQNLKQNQSRFWFSVMGVGLALSLVLALDAVVAGLENQLTAYIERSGADVWVAQEGVRNLHMVSSNLPAEVASRIAELPGVSAVTPLLYTTQMLGLAGNSKLSYVIGLPHDAVMGRPTKIIQGLAELEPGEMIVDQQGQAAKISLADTIRLFGRNFKVVGLSSGLSNPITNVVFISFEDFARFRQVKDTVSFVLVKTEHSEKAKELASYIESEVPGVTATSGADFAKEERKIIKDMGLKAITLMNALSSMIGLAVLMLTIYLATLTRWNEYGVLRALGARKVELFKVVFAQTFFVVILGLGVALSVTVLLALILPHLNAGLTMKLQITGVSVLKTTLTSFLLAFVAALLPIVQLNRLDPAAVFQGVRKL